MQRYLERPELGAAVDPASARPAIKLGAAEWALIVLNSVSWGTAFFFGSIAVKELPPMTITGFRLLPAAVLVLSACALSGYRIPRTFDYWRRSLILGLVNNMLPLLLILWAQHRVTGGVAAVFNATTPLFAVLLAHVATTDERLSARKVAGILAGVIGVSVLVGADVLSGTTGDTLAKGALLAAAFLYAAAGVYARRFDEPPFVIAAGQMMSALVLSLPLALVIDRPWTLPTPSWQAVAAVIGMGTISSALAALTYFTVLRRAGATSTLVATLLLPVTPIALGALFLGDRLSPREYAGAAIIGVALVVLDGRALRALQRLGRRQGERS